MTAQGVRLMVVMVLLASLLGSVIGMGLGFYWGLSGGMIALLYVLGGMTCAATATLLAAMAHNTKAEQHDQAADTGAAINTQTARQI